MIELVEKYSLLLIETVVAIVIWIMLKLIVGAVIKRRLKLIDFNESRRRMAKKSINVALNLILGATIITIWSVDQSNIWVFLSSTLTILGVAFFAQWSHLSNITSGVIIFFNTATKIGDQIKIMDKDFDIQGEIFDVGIMFFKILTPEHEIISIPNNVIIQKAIKTNNHRLMEEVEEVTGNIEPREKEKDHPEE